MPQTPPGPVQFIRKVLPYTTVVALLALLYLAWVFYSRASERREAQRAADEKQVEQARKTYELYGAGQLKILLFYAVPATVSRGASGELCYSLANATSASIDHDVEAIRPSLNRCVPIKPAHSTTYTLTASDDKGHKVAQSVSVVVR
jgi:hypothetical protein